MEMQPPLPPPQLLPSLAQPSPTPTPGQLGSALWGLWTRVSLEPLSELTRAEPPREHPCPPGPTGCACGGPPGPETGQGFSVLLGDGFGACMEGLLSLVGSPHVRDVEGPAVAMTRLLTLGAPVVGRCDALELLLPCCVPAVRGQRAGNRGGRLSHGSSQSSAVWAPFSRWEQGLRDRK